MGKLIVITAPSGAGKTTIVRHLLQKFGNLAFSVSATTRTRRAEEQEGKDYYYIKESQFKVLIDEGAFLEWEEVYENQFYGTLKIEVQRLWEAGKSVIFDIDVKGAIHVKEAFPDLTLTVFIKPPSAEILFDRLKKRKSETEQSLKKRIEKAAYELTFEPHFDIALTNDILETTLKDAERIVGKWLKQ